MQNIDQWNSSNDPHFSTRNVLAFDLDDTLTDHGVLNSHIITRIEEAHRKGLTTLLVTGRPAGWADTLVRLLPLDAVLCENGAAFYFWENGKQNRKKGEGPQRLFWHSDNHYKEEIPADNLERKKQAKEALLKAFPKTQVASDQKFRLYDLAIDFAEELPVPLSFAEAQKIKKKFEEFGATAKVSSIHVNGWWGSFSKSSALSYFATHCYNFSIAENLVYVGDSPNDAPLFEMADCSIGVANLLEFSQEIDFVRPKYICNHSRDKGAEEVLDKILSHHS